MAPNTSIAWISKLETPFLSGPAVLIVTSVLCMLILGRWVRTACILSINANSSGQQYSTRTDILYVKGIFEIPGAVPFFGHLLKLGEDQATVCAKWWRQYQHFVFQIRLGNTRAVVFNSFDDIRRILIGHQSAVIDPPKLYTFHGVISSTQCFTIGSSPWGESTKNRRKAAGQALGRPAMRSYFPMFDLESYCIVRDFNAFSKNGADLISVRPFIQRYALNKTLILC